ncbi:hypothetical protein ABIE66_004223 [Peribacillus sp. B2I2]|uniref:hypothetical protein n=1 Tax=Peribacillus sp. B2I2 TaxID=3156468 RepID=UPI003516DDB7
MKMIRENEVHFKRDWNVGHSLSAGVSHTLSNQLCFSFKLKKFATLLPNNWLAACGEEAWQTIGERERISENN